MGFIYDERNPISIYCFSISHIQENYSTDIPSFITQDIHSFCSPRSDHFSEIPHEISLPVKYLSIFHFTSNVNCIHSEAAERGSNSVHGKIMFYRNKILQKLYLYTKQFMEQNSL